jgi:hypothetical protein
MPQSSGKQEKDRSEAIAEPGRTGGASRRANAHAARRSICEVALARVVELAQSTGADTRETRRSLPSGRSRPGDGEATAPALETSRASAREQLSTAFRELEPEVALKLRTLMIAGRDGQSIGAVNVNLSLSDDVAAFAIMAADSSDNGLLLVDYLRRGHALACAAGIDLDKPLTDWQVQSSQELEERAWATFGKQLATSQPNDWQCLGIVEKGTQGLTKLYLKLGDLAWWSFQSALDRPTLAGVDKDRRELARRQVKGLSTNTLEGIVGHLGSAQGRALRRAARAIRARVGVSLSAER